MDDPKWRGRTTPHRTEWQHYLPASYGLPLGWRADLLRFGNLLVEYASQPFPRARVELSFRLRKLPCVRHLRTQPGAMHQGGSGDEMMGVEV